ncbi:MAG: hypothetical protein ACPG2Y_03030, partial [Acholeplasmataceae bacterium]
MFLSFIFPVWYDLFCVFINGVFFGCGISWIPVLFFIIVLSVLSLMFLQPLYSFLFWSLWLFKAFWSVFWLKVYLLFATFDFFGMQHFSFFKLCLQCIFDKSLFERAWLLSILFSFSLSSRSVYTRTNIIIFTLHRVVSKVKQRVDERIMTGHVDISNFPAF